MNGSVAGSRVTDQDDAVRQTTGHAPPVLGTLILQALITGWPWEEGLANRARLIGLASKAYKLPMYTLSNTSSFKIIENHKGQATVKNVAQAVSA